MGADIKSSFWTFQPIDKSSTTDGDGILALPKAYWALACDPTINKHLAGTALCWFFFDVYVYGVSAYFCVSVFSSMGFRMLCGSDVRISFWYYFDLGIIYRLACTRPKFSRTFSAAVRRSQKIIGKTCCRWWPPYLHLFCPSGCWEKCLQGTCRLLGLASQLVPFYWWPSSGLTSRSTRKPAYFYSFCSKKTCLCLGSPRPLSCSPMSCSRSAFEAAATACRRRLGKWGPSSGPSCSRTFTITRRWPPSFTPVQQ